MNSAPDHKGHCPECGNETFTCWDELCEDCFEDQPVTCQHCKEQYQKEEMYSDTKCEECFRADQEEYKDMMKEIYKIR